MRIDIYFKNVGQGDTILLEWQDKDTDPFKHALIDCNLVNGSIQPITDHIERHKIKAFEFVILSHPHTDHFSGFHKFFDCCEEKGIAIKKFIHTAAYDSRFLETLMKKTKNKGVLTLCKSVNRKKDKVDLLELYFRISGLNDNRKIDVQVINNDYLIPLTADIDLQFLAPFAYGKEIRDYLNGNYNYTSDAEKLKFEKKGPNNPLANCLSSVLRIGDRNETWNVLLCSDCQKSTFDENLVYSDKLKGNIIAAQIPHHGSENNHSEEFWNSVKLDSKSVAVISAGGKYGHPSRDVVSFFDHSFGEVHCTNDVGGFREHFSNEIEYYDVLDFDTIPGTGVKIVNDNLGGSTNSCGEKQLSILGINDKLNWAVKNGS